jgi:hypothetical protein
MASILKVDAIQELSEGNGIELIGKIRGPSGDLTSAQNWLTVTRRSLNITEEITANLVHAQTYTGIQLEHFIPNANTAMTNEVLSKNADGSYSFRAPVTAGDTGISADFTNFIDGGGPATVFISSQVNIDGGTP